jgi:HMG-box domain
MNIGSVELFGGSFAAPFLRSGEVSVERSMKYSSAKLVIADSDTALSPSDHPMKPTILGASALLKQPLIADRVSIERNSVGKKATQTLQEKKTRRKKKWKKPKDKPNRPLSAYNLFFAETRATMLGDDAPTPEQEALKKRVHCKTHGKIGFAVMAKTIGTKWKALGADEKKVFEDKARKEKDRYLVELSSWKDAQKGKQVSERETESSKGLDAMATAAMVSNLINTPSGSSPFSAATRHRQNMNMSMNMNMHMISNSIDGSRHSADSMRLLLERRMHSRTMSHLESPHGSDYIRAMQDRSIDQTTLSGLSAGHHQQHPRQPHQQQHHRMLEGAMEQSGGSSDGKYANASEASANIILNHFQSGFPSSSSCTSRASPSSASNQMNLQSQDLFESQRLRQFATMRRLQQGYMSPGMASGGMAGINGGGFGMHGSMNRMNGF